LSKVWFFGDSFCHPCEFDHNNNIVDYWWGKIYADQLNKTPILRSKGGSSIEYAVMQLEDNLMQIGENDVAVICYTTPHRWYFWGKNISVASGLNIIDSESYPVEVLDAAKRNILYLYDSEQQERLWFSQVFYIQQSLIPLLKSRNVTVKHFYSFPPPVNNQINHFELLVLPVAETFVIESAQSMGLRPEPILQTPGHFGNPTTACDLNKAWAEIVSEA